MHRLTGYGCWFAGRHARRASGSLWKPRSKANAKSTRQPAKGAAASAPSAPPRSGFVQPCAAANGGGPSRLQSTRFVAAVAELGSLGIMRTPHRKFVWFISAAFAGSIAVALFASKHPPVTLSVVSVQSTSGSPKAQCVISNQGDRPIEFTIHSLGDVPFYHRLQRPPLSLRRVLSDWRSAVSWRPVGWDMECGIDAETRVLAPGQTFPFTASIIDTSRPIRLAVSYRLDGSNFTASSRTIYP